MKLEITINGAKSEYETTPNITLIQFLREHGYFSVKRGCEDGSCGSCVVEVDNIPKKSCLIFIGQVNGKEVTTVEGIGTQEDPHPIQDEFVKNGAVQCGFCIPGMIMSAHALLIHNPRPSDEDIKIALNGNLCRCTGYTKQIESVQKAASRLKEDK